MGVTEMAMYKCSGCDEYVDDDWLPCTEDKKTEFGLLCPDCAMEREEESEARAYEISQRHAQWCAEKGLA